MATVSDPTVEFMAQFSDQTKWLVKSRVPLFKPHERIKTDAKGNKSIAYTVTAEDMAEIAANMRKNQAKGVPARMTVGHVNPSHETPETDQPHVVGYWLNAEPGTFGPDNEPCVYVDAYAKREHAAEVKGRPYRSAEYYPATKEIRGAALLTRDPQLDLGTVEIYKGAYFYSAPGEFYMADEVKDLPDVGMKEVEPAGHKEWCANMEHYGKSNQWVSHAMQNYQASAASATNTCQPEPAKPAKEPEMERMERDDQAANYSRLAAQVAELTKAREADRDTIAKLTAERDREQCERMVKQLQLEGYTQLKTAETVERLVKKSPEDRDEYIATIKQFAVPTPTGQVIEVYSGPMHEPGKGKTSLTAEEAGRAAKYAAGDNKRFEKARSALLAGQPIED